MNTVHIKFVGSYEAECDTLAVRKYNFGGVTDD